jgi:hypothetical protein
MLYTTSYRKPNKTFDNIAHFSDTDIICVFQNCINFTSVNYAYFIGIIAVMCKATRKHCTFRKYWETRKSRLEQLNRLASNNKYIVDISTLIILTLLQLLL